MLIWLLILGLLLSLAWSGFLTLQLRKITANYASLTGGKNKKTIEEIVGNALRELSIAKKDIDNLTNRCAKIEKNETYHIQKIGLLRFNPFNDTGGDQSFILTLSDANDTGVIITGLYSRSGTRWYAKRILNGKGSEHELSDEEKKALKIAKNIKEIN
jgi:hypothetical protein